MSSPNPLSRNPSARRSPRIPLAVALLALAASACGEKDTSLAPTLLSTSPLEGALDVPTNTSLSASFDLEMAPLSRDTFTVKQGSTAVPGTVATTENGRQATFEPEAALAKDSVYTATITAGATSRNGVTLAADHVWTFTTGATIDSGAPEVQSTRPGSASVGVAINTLVSVVFTEQMNPVSITTATFTLTQGSSAIPGTVSYGPGTTATFTPSAHLPISAVFTATLTTGIKDLSGNPLAATHAWTFTTGTTTAQGPAPVGLGTAGNFAVLAKSGVSSVPASTVTGHVGLGPAAATYLTGFSLVADSTNVFATSTQIVGRAYAANYAVPTPSNLTTAVSNMETAYTDAAGRPTPDFLELGTGDIGGQTLQPGLYKWTSTVIIPADVTLSGGANDVWIFQTTGDLTMSADKSVILSGGAQAKNVFWQVAGNVVVGTGAHFEGILIGKNDVTLQTGSTMNGRILAQKQVALQQATVTQPAQ